MEKEFEENMKLWLAQHGFNEERITYVYFPDDSYARRAELKSDGFIFDKVLMWHRKDTIEKYADSLVPIKLAAVAESTAWGSATYYPFAADLVRDEMMNARPYIERNYIGEVGEKFNDMEVILSSRCTARTKYGITSIINFMRGDDKITWYTTTYVPYDNGTRLLLSGVIKKHDEYKGDPVTVVKNCKMKEISE